jgi:membrane associated rhomboid family serine protease
MPSNRYRNDSFTMGLPPFAGAVRAIILVSTAIYVLILLSNAFAPALGQMLIGLGLLSADAVLHGQVWRLLTYGFVNVDPLNFLLSMVGVYFLGSAVQGAIGSRRFGELYMVSLVVAAVLGCLITLVGPIGSGPAYGAGPATNAILMAFFLLYRDQSIMIFPLPIQIPAKYIVIFTAAVEIAYLLLSRFALFYLVLLSGLLAGYLWFSVRMGQRSSRQPAIGFGRGLSDRMYAVAPAKSEPLMTRMKNSYHRWKRRRMAKKFEVYMRKHDRSVYFDEHGNYRGHEVPDEEKKPDGDNKGGWVN